MSSVASHLQCLCGAINEPASLLSSSNLPIETDFCHCNPCRQTTGAVGSTCAELNGPPSTKSLALSTCYSRPGGDDRYHCSTCGTRTFDHIKSSDRWVACSGIIEPPMKDGEHSNIYDVIKITSHNFVSDTGDGGLALLMRCLGGRYIPCYMESGNPDSPALTDEELYAFFPRDLTKRQESLNVSCHCGTIRFRIVRPRADIMQRPQSVTRWLSADGTKFKGLLCACRSCRLTFGTSFAYQTYVTPENILIRSQGSERSPFNYTSYSEHTGSLRDSTASLQASFPGLKCYYHSADNRRSFCGRCGASVFFEREGRAQCVNVAAGILRAESGCLAREWVEWEQKMVWSAEEAVDREMVEGYLEGWKALEGMERL